MVITDKFIVQGISKNGGWTRAQLELLGVEWPPTRGWKGRIIGNELSDSDAEFETNFAALVSALKTAGVDDLEEYVSEQYFEILDNWGN